MLNDYNKKPHSFSGLVFATILPCLLLSGAVASAQDAPPSLPDIDLGDPTTYRSYDGTGNNATNNDWGSANTQLIRLFDADYADGSTPSGGDRPSAREISNQVSAQDMNMPSDKGLSSLFWSFGQLLAHDLTLVPGTSPVEYFNIPVADDDDFFGAVDHLPLNRSKYDPATGTDASNPRQQVNTISAFIDASFVYGSDHATANILRANNGTGRLMTGPGDMLPTNGQLGLDGDPMNDHLFVAGDDRANEQLALSAMHTVFMREHNRLADLIAADNPDLSGDEVFQMARAIVGAEMQAITYNEFLPVLLGTDQGMPAYEGYDPTVNPGISNAFATAAYRLGHTLLQNDFLIIGPEGPVENLALASCFFNPTCLNTKGLEATMFGLAHQDAQIYDTLFVDAVRNNLITDFGITMAVDLAANNIQRGRDHGLPSYEAVYAQLLQMGLISGDSSIADDIFALYGDSEVDLLVGGLAETPFGDALVGEVFYAILMEQFTRLRDGDRFWYEGSTLFDGDMVSWLNSISMADLILWNTDIEFLQAYGFFTVDFGLARAVTPNQTVTANYLNALTTANVDAYDLYMVGVHISAADDMTRALDMVHPEWFNMFTEAGLSHARLALNEVSRRATQAWSGRHGTSTDAQRVTPGASSGASGGGNGLSFWINGGMSWQDVGSKDGYLGFESETTSVWTGVDYLVSDGTLLGIMVGYADTDIDADGRNGDGDAQSWQFAGYAAFNLSGWQFNVSGGYGDLDISSERDIAISDFERTASADYGGSFAYGQGQAGYEFEADNGWRIRPGAGLSYIRVKQDAFMETGADFLNLTVLDQSHKSLRLLGHVDVYKAFVTGNADQRIVPHARIGIAHEFKDNLRPITASLGGAGFGFTVDGAVAAQTTAQIGAGVDFQLSEIFWLYIDWQGEFGSGFSDHTARAGALLQF